VAKRRVGRYSIAFRQMAIERMRSCENIGALAEELGVHRRLLYRWRDQLEGVDSGDGQQRENRREFMFRQENSQLKRALADKTLEVDFFKGALQKIEARRQRSTKCGEKASTTKSGK
jgi:transposase-like protein